MAPRKIKIEFPLVKRMTMEHSAGVSKEYLRTLRDLLPEGIYWFRMPNCTSILFNERLIIDYLVNGNSPSHQKAVELFISTLPSSQAA